jgi:drug/metabolite transporter (DMT)-like permease
MNIYEVILLTLFAALVSSFAQLEFKRSVGRISSARDVLALASNKGVLIGVVGYVASLGIYLFALSGSGLSFVYPLFASSFIFVTLLSALILKERVTAIRIAGILFIFIGISIVALS